MCIKYKRYYIYSDEVQTNKVFTTTEIERIFANDFSNIQMEYPKKNWHQFTILVKMEKQYSMHKNSEKRN